MRGHSSFLNGTSALKILNEENRKNFKEIVFISFDLFPGRFFTFKVFIFKF